MPNWCFNELTVGGNYKEFKKKLIDGKRLQFESFIPMPEEEKENWYDWSFEHWGTKWDIPLDSQDTEEFEDSIRITFDTAWSPCIPFVQTISAMYPDLAFTLRYFEIGNLFAGSSMFKYGEEINSFGTQDEYEIQEFVVDQLGFDPFELPE